jgi:tetratricopeptide (TPR) repeat protein
VAAAAAPTAAPAAKRALASPGAAASVAGGAATASAAVAAAAASTAAPAAKRARVSPGAAASGASGAASAAVGAAAASTAAAAVGAPSAAPVSAAQNAKAARLFDEGITFALSAEKWAEARGKFRDAVDVNPMHGNAWSFLGGVIFKVNGDKDSEETIEAYERAIATKTMSVYVAVTAHSNLALALFDFRKDYVRALVECRKVIALEPSSASVHFLMAIALGPCLGRWAEARDAMAKAAELGHEKAKAELPAYTRRAA